MIRAAAPLRTAQQGQARQGIDADSVLVASWCRSVGATWTVELRSWHGRPVPNPAGAAQGGPVVEWICSGVPTELPAPDGQTVEVLGARDLLLFPDGPVVPAPRTRSRRVIGYVTRDPEVMRLALILAELIDQEPDHPMVLAAQWIQAGYSVDAAAGWVTAGVTWPSVARALLSTELNPSG